MAAVLCVVVGGAQNGQKQHWFCTDGTTYMENGIKQATNISLQMSAGATAQNVKKRDVVDEVGPVAFFTISGREKSSIRKRFKRFTLCATATLYVEIRVLVKQHELEADNDLSGREDVVLADFSMSHGGSVTIEMSMIIYFCHKI